MDSKPLVSVVIATYNMAEYLPLAVQSVLDQTYGSVEVVIVDDGSTDHTVKAVAAFRDNARVKYLFQINSGQAAAKNHGVRESTGSFIAFLDADDIWVPDKLDLQMPMFLGADKLGVVYSRLSYIDESGQDVGVADNELFRGWVTGSLLIRNFIGFGSVVVRKECFDRLGGFRDDLRMGIDYDLWLRFSTQYEFDFVDRPLLRYRVWSGQMSKNCKGRYLNGIAIMERFLGEFPGIVDRATQNYAWAHTYVGFGQCLQSLEPQIGPALKFYARALRYKPGYIPAWRAIIASLLRLR